MKKTQEKEEECKNLFKRHLKPKHQCIVSMDTYTHRKCRKMKMTMPLSTFMRVTAHGEKEKPSGLTSPVLVI